MSLRTAGARGGAGARVLRLADRRPAGSARSEPDRPIGPWAFTGFAVASFGGPLALAALIAPGLAAGDAGASSGLEMVAALVVFGAPVAIWLRFSREVASAGGLYSFVEAAAGRRVALVQAATWAFSYLLYVVYTTVQIVYDLLPAVFAGERRYQTLLALAIPIVLAGVMIAGRTTALVVIGLMAAGQLALAGVLDGLTLGHLTTPVSSFGTGAPAGPLVKAGAQTSLLYVCGSLPLFLGGEVARPERTIRRGLLGAFALTGLVVVLAVAPLASFPGFLHADVPGVSVARAFAGDGLANAIGIGVAVSTAAVILCEYLALTRLVHAVTAWRPRPITLVVGVLLIISGPISLIDPDGFYDTLLKPSLVALWLSQLIVFLAYPRFAARRRMRPLPAWTLSAVASALAVYGLWTALHPSGGS